ncbi:DUF2922 domain-containing protein [Bacillus sp. OK048]|uniref:DUF2922 domain-containing protein n=1 Tax=Bacillus sp. OK048 TaxID=1882761 RepID=UPI000891C412|nr:DUF2922 domain-containing protein [Bacillus sp. OK048]SDN57588.1 Protein of unknown function [Bacillus sp. OK048]
MDVIVQLSGDLTQKYRLSIDNPKEPIEEAAIKQTMEEIIAAEVFFTTGGKFVSAKGARAIERNVTDYELV